MALFGLAAILLFAGCSTRLDLSRRQLQSLARQSVDPAELGLAVSTNHLEAIELGGFYEYDPGFTARGRLLEISQGSQSLPILEIVINGHPVPALIDTGSSMSLAGMRTVQSGGIVPLGQPMFSFWTLTFSGNKRVALGLAESVDFGGGVTRRVPFTILNRVPGLPYDPFNVLGDTDVLIGEDLLRRFGAVTLSHLSRSYMFNADPIERGEDNRTVHAFALTHRRTMGVSVFTARINGKRDIRVAFDSGGSFGLWVPEKLAGELLLPGLQGLQPVRGASGGSLPPMFRRVAPATLEVDGVTIRNLSCYVGRIQGGNRDPDFVLLGNEVLEMYDIRLNDFGNRIEFLKPLRLP